MNLSTFYTRVNNTLRGTDDSAPAHGTDEAIYWLDTLNRKKDELYEDVTKNWRNVFQTESPNETGTVATTGTTTLTGTGTYFTDYAVGDKITVSGETERTIDTITSDTVLTVSVAFSNTASALTFTRKTIILTGVTEYSLHRSFLNLSGNKNTTDGVGSGVYVITTDDERIDIPVISAEQQSPIITRAFVAGLHPQKVYFTGEIASTDSIVGGQLFTPGYFMPDDVEDETDLLPFLDPNWAVMAVASEIAFADITYEDKAPDLNVKANNLYTQMIKKNRGLTFNTPRTIPTNMKRIRDTRTSE
jgi:hypothetical protein